MFRKEFDVTQPIRRATLYATALGAYEVYLNGQRVGDDILAPGWTTYSKRVQYRTHDVTDLVAAGQNAIGGMLGSGWYAGRVSRRPWRAPRLLVQLEIELDNGRTLTVISDGSWRSTTEGPIRSSDIYDGETVDARLEMPGWDRAGYDDSEWTDVDTEAPGGIQRVRGRSEPIRVVKELNPVGMKEPKPGVYVFDMGQNMVGWCRLTIKGPAGTTIRMRHGERLNPDGTLYTDNLNHARQTDRYTKGTDGLEMFEPRFTYHGFRYVELTGLDEPPPLHSIVGRVFRSASPEAGRFSCSNELINQLISNIFWSQQGNMQSVFTDCPQRAERKPWLGDLQPFAQAAIFNMDMAGFLSKCIQDIRDCQGADGCYPTLALGGPCPTPAWSDAGTIVPWRMYQNYADKRLVAEHFESARRWVDFVRGQNPNLLWQNSRGGDYGDWLGPLVPKELLATAFWAHSTEIVAKMASVLGLKEEEAYYRKMFEEIKAAFNKAYVSDDGRIEGDSQGGYALALRFNLLPESVRPLVAAKMVDAVAHRKGQLRAGFQTAHRVMLELTRNGYNDEAYRLINRKTFPSWGYMIEMGATTIWERWDGYVEGREFQHTNMNSFNHAAFGSVGEWVWRTIAGINPDEAQPGYKHFVIHPRPAESVTWAKAEYDSIRGRIASDWRAENGQMTLKVTIPPNTTATVHVPASDVSTVRESEVPARLAAGVSFVGMKDGCAVFEAQSGSYRFVSRL